MSDTVVWVHGDCLSPFNPALVAHPGAPALFVFDDTLLTRRRVSLKRIMFMYECLLELPVVIRRGDVSAQLAAFTLEHNATHIVTTESVSPQFRTICDSLRKALPVATRLEILPVEPFVSFEGRLDLKRFSRFWSSIRDLALSK